MIGSRFKPEQQMHATSRIKECKIKTIEVIKGRGRMTYILDSSKHPMELDFMFDDIYGDRW